MGQSRYVPNAFSAHIGITNLNLCKVLDGITLEIVFREPPVQDVSSLRTDPLKMLIQWKNFGDKVVRMKKPKFTEDQIVLPMEAGRSGSRCVIRPTTLDIPPDRSHTHSWGDRRESASYEKP